MGSWVSVLTGCLRLTNGSPFTPRALTNSYGVPIEHKQSETRTEPRLPLEASLTQKNGK